MERNVNICGKLIPCDEFNTLDMNCREVLDRHKIPYDPNQVTIYNQIGCNYCWESFPYIVINGALYKIVERIDLPTTYFLASRNDDDSIDFNMKYDTSDMGFDDAIFLALESGS